MKHIEIFESFIEEKSDTTLTSDRLKSEKGNDTKRMANFFNKYYKINIPLDGNWKNPDYMKAMQRFVTEKKIDPIWTCRKGDGYCKDEQEGEITIRDAKARAKFNSIMKNILLDMLMKN